MNVQRVAMANLKQPPRNIRIHSQKQMEEYCRSLKKFGQTKPIICDEDFMILAGNGLYLALKAIGAEEAWCNIVQGLSKADKKKLMLADNKVYELGITDMSAIDDILATLGDDLDIPGYDDDLLKMLSMSTREATEMAMDYGTVDVRPNAPQESSFQTREELKGQNPYTGVYNPEMAQSADEVTAETRKFLLCPKCGERIWL